MSFNEHIEKLDEVAKYYADIGPFSVTDKTVLEFTSDSRDYVSGRLYWWKEGDTYVRKDGRPNPIYRGQNFDRQRLEDLINSIVSFTLYYLFTGNEKYIDQASIYLNTWFIQSKTRMNPHLEFAQIVPSEEQDGTGIIDTYDFIYMLDAIDILKDKKLLSDELYTGVQRWFTEFVCWLLRSPQGKIESSRPNNHGTSFDVQVSRYLIFVGKTFKAKYTLYKNLRCRFKMQIEHHGNQPKEMSRTKSLYYHWYNLSKLIHLYQNGVRVGLKKKKYEEKIYLALAYLHPYLERPELWPYEQIEAVQDYEIAETIQLSRQFKLRPDFDKYMNAKAAHFNYLQLEPLKPSPSLLKRLTE